MKSTIKLVLAGAFMLNAMGAALANSNMFDDTIASCTTLNCSTQVINGTVYSVRPGAPPDVADAGYWEIGVWARRAECLRLHVTFQRADMEMVVRAPNGSVYRNDNGNSGLCPLCPRIVIGSTPVEGFYSVTLASSTGAPIDANFRLQYGRYVAGTANNCASPTAPLGVVPVISSAQSDDAIHE